MAKLPINELLERELTRKQFLAALGLGAISLLGFSALSGMFTKNEPHHTNELPGYGMNKYGP